MHALPVLNKGREVSASDYNHLHNSPDHFLNYVLVSDATRQLHCCSVNGRSRSACIENTFFLTPLIASKTQVSNQSIAALHESGILQFFKYPWASQNPLSDKSYNWVVKI